MRTACGDDTWFVLLLLRKDFEVLGGTLRNLEELERTWKNLEELRRTFSEVTELSLMEKTEKVD